MAEIVKLEDHRPRKTQNDPPTIIKIFDGKIIECVNIDALPPDEQRKYFDMK